MKSRFLFNTSAFRILRRQKFRSTWDSKPLEYDHLFIRRSINEK